MRVLIVNKFLYPNGGSETYIFQIGKQLEKIGHEVQYFGMEHEGRIVGNRVESYTADMDFHTGKLKKLLYPFKIIYSLEARAKIRPVLEDFQPDVVHLNNFNFQITPSILYEIRSFEKKKGRKIKIVYTAHDYQLVCPNHLMLRPSDYELCEKCAHGNAIHCIRGKCIHGSAVKSALGTIEAWVYRTLHAHRMIDQVICPSRFMAEKLAASPDLKDRLVVMHNFVDAVPNGKNVRSEAAADQETTGRKQNRYVLYFGRFCREKGVETLLEICRSLPQIPFVFAGSGPMEAEVNAAENVENRGFLSGEELHRLISEAEFTIFPSEWYENCPFSVMETQMYGTPVIASNLGGTPELVLDGVSGMLFEAGKEEELRAKIEELWNDSKLLRQYTDGCENVNYDTAESYCEKLIKVYQE